MSRQDTPFQTRAKTLFGYCCAVTERSGLRHEQLARVLGRLGLELVALAEVQEPLHDDTIRPLLEAAVQQDRTPAELNEALTVFQGTFHQRELILRPWLQEQSRLWLEHGIARVANHADRSLSSALDAFDLSFATDGAALAWRKLYRCSVAQSERAILQRFRQLIDEERRSTCPTTTTNP